jgi:sucrose-6-phosphatase
MQRFLLVTDLDNTYVGDRPALEALQQTLQAARTRGAKLVYSTGRSHHSYQTLAEEENLLPPDILVTSVGTEIRIDNELDTAWSKHLNSQWSIDRIRQTTDRYPALVKQPAAEQNPYKISFFLHPNAGSVLTSLAGDLESQSLKAQIIYSSKRDVDIVPVRADKGNALNYVREKLGFSLDETIACGDSGNDIALFTQNTLGIIVGNARSELLQWHQKQGDDRQYLAQGHYAAGILEGLNHFGFGEI